jgi:drug/metabolite transporter (DMT)-like permease
MKQLSWESVSPLLKVSFAVIVWGASFIATKVALKEVHPITVVWLRFTIGVVILGVTVFLRRQFTLPVGKELRFFGLLGFLGITFHQWLQSTGLLTSKASTTAWIVATTPIFIAILGWLILKEKLRWLQIMGIGLATFGVLLVVSEGDLSSIAIGKIGNPGDFLILISAINWAVFSVISRRGLQNYPAALMMFFVMGFGWIFLTLMFLLARGWGDLKDLTLNGWIGVLFLGIFCSGLAYIFWYDALKLIPATRVGAFLYFEPFIAVSVAAFILDENIISVALIGGVVILIGVWMVNTFLENE